MKHLYVVWVLLHVLLGTLVLIVSYVSIVPYINFYTVKGVVGFIVTLLITVMGISGTGDLIVKIDKKRCFLKPYIKWQWTHKVGFYLNIQVHSWQYKFKLMVDNCMGKSSARTDTTGDWNDLV